ncbi:MAG: hypothetical protein K2H01_09985 [Ruminococcus sp.]|nr:hypothetical protein [Ruminococcus sp.]
MLSIHAYYTENKVFVDRKNEYAVGEILTAYLNTDYYNVINEKGLVNRLRELCVSLIIYDNMSSNHITNYNSVAYESMRIIAQINEWIYTLPPYNKSLQKLMPELEYFLNNYEILFEQSNKDVSTLNYDTYHLTEFVPCAKKKFKSYLKETLIDFEKNLTEYFDMYINFLESYMAVHTIFKPFIDNYLHSKETFLTSNEIADCFDKFNRGRLKSFNEIQCQMKSFGYNVITDSKGKPMLCEDIIFNNLKSFLFYDFFKGVNINYIPNQCKQCGKYFLIEGKYFRFCNNPVDNDPEKTCRDIGSRRRYDEKCKNDPIWQTYNRAYKAHYARYMKKKMTIAEFEQWSRSASELRDKAIANKIPYDEYYNQIRK